MSMMFSHPPTEWRIADVERKAESANSRLHELDALRSDVGRLEHSLRELSAEITELRSQVITLQDQAIEQLNERITALQSGGKP